MSMKDEAVAALFMARATGYPGGYRCVEEGWIIATTGRAIPYELQRLPSRGFFLTDADAQRFVVKQARTGSAYHLHALAWLFLNCRSEWDVICNACRCADLFDGAEP